jgi:hypothetical protein
MHRAAIYEVIDAFLLCHGRIVRVDGWVRCQFGSVGFGLLAVSMAKVEEDQGNFAGYSPSVCILI